MSALIKDAKVGDEVVLTDFGDRVRRVKVSTVGRVWMTVTGRAGKFDRGNGLLRDFTQVRIQTVAEYDRANEQAAKLVVARNELRAFGVEVRGVKASVVLEIREALLGIIPRRETAEPTSTASEKGK